MKYVVYRVLDLIVNMSRINKQLIMLFIDFVLLILILLASFSIRLGFWYFPESDLIWVIFGAPVIAIPIFIQFGLYKAVIRYIDFNSLWSLTHAVSLYALLWGIVGFMAAVDGIPRSVILINWMLSLLVIGGLRISAQTMLSGKVNFFAFNDESKNKKKRSLIYGAGSAGVQLVSALEYSSEYNPVGFIDDDIDLQGQYIKGLNIFSADKIQNVIYKLKVEEVLIAMPSVSRKKRLTIINKLEPYSVSVRIVPSVTELAEGMVNIGDLREINIKDLLGRDPIEPNLALLGINIANKVVMVTGAGGSIGSEMCRQIVYLKPKALILYESNELALYAIEKELAGSSIFGFDIYPVLGDINNRERLQHVFKHFSVNTIYHAAAYKHVPMVEFNNTEGVNNNIFGTLNCAEAAIDEGVETFVLISTDKAVRPSNTMGATKRTAELILQALSINQTITKFSIVRFGNVLGSSGSVIPLFQDQIKKGGPITITDINMMRYFMTIPEAVELVIQAGAMGEGGDVFVLDMGKPIVIYDLAIKMIGLSGLQILDTDHPDGDIEIKYTGLRPGEKLYEELLVGNNVSETEHKLIMRAKEEMIDWQILEPILKELKEALIKYDHKRIREILLKIVPEFKPQSSIVDLLYKE